MGKYHGADTPSWWSTTVPTVGPTGTSTTWVCARYQFNTSGRIFGVRFYDGFSAHEGTPVLIVSDEAGSQQYFDGGVYFYYSTLPSSAAWRNIWLRPAKPVVTTAIYTVMALYKGGGFYRKNNQVTSLGTPVYNGHIGLRSSMQLTGTDPSSASFVENLNANAVDVLFLPD